MKVYGLYGKSGTGKSHKASEVVHKYEIEGVIDDGILIFNKTKVAGQSAKNEKTYVSATKRAIFFWDDHRDEVAAYLKKASIQRLLILGTSKKMIRIIASRLGLPNDIEWIPIESLQTAEEIELARERRQRGYHIIPIRPIEVEKTYSGSWFRKLVIRLGKRQEEVTLVKPQYLKGKITIHPSCFRDIIQVLIEPDMHLHSVKAENEFVWISLSLQEGVHLNRLKEWQELCSEQLAKMIGSRYEVNIEWRSILPGKRSSKRVEEL